MVPGQKVFKLPAADVIVPAVVPYPVRVRHGFDYSTQFLLTDAVQIGSFTYCYDRLYFCSL